MATVVATQSFTARLEADVLGEDRIEHHSEFPGQPSVFRGGKVYPEGYVDAFGRKVGGKLQPTGSLVVNVVKKGRSITVVKGQRYEDNHPVVKRFPEMFGREALHPIEAPPIEQATAAPGERRNR